MEDHDKLQELSTWLALNYVDMSTEVEDENNTIQKIFNGSKDPKESKNKASDAFDLIGNRIKPRHRNILILGAGASKNANDHFKIGYEAASEIRKTVENELGNKQLIEEELKRLSQIYRLNINDFETILLACSKFSRKTVLSQLKKIYGFKHYPNLFYEIAAHMFKHRFIDVIVNFNFDEILDNAIEDELPFGDYYNIYSDGHCPVDENEFKKEWLIGEKRLKKPIYIKPHGTISHLSSLKFTREDYFHLSEQINSLMDWIFTGYFEHEVLTLNFIIVGFRMQSFEFNEMLKQTLEKRQAVNCDLSKKDVNIFYFHYNNSLDAQNIQTEINAGDEFRINIYPIDYKDITLDKIFDDLWTLTQSQINHDKYKIKSIVRHKIINKIFETYRQNLDTSNIIDYLRDRITVELAMEIISSKGFFNFEQLKMGRVNKYFGLLKNHEPTANFSAFLRYFKLAAYKGFSKNTFYLQSTDGFYIEDTGLRIDFILEILKRKLIDKRQDKIIKESNNLRELFHTYSLSHNLNIKPNYTYKNIIDFENIQEKNIIATELKWLYKFNELFESAEWNLLLVSSESGGVLHKNPFCKQIIGNSKKRIEIVFADTSIVRKGGISERDTLLKKFKSLSSAFLNIDSDGIPIIKTLPWRSHNQHFSLFCNVNITDNSLSFLGGFYYRRSLMSKYVTPIYIDSNIDHETLLSIFCNYWKRSINVLEVGHDDDPKAGIKSRGSLEEAKYEIIEAYKKSLRRN